MNILPIDTNIQDLSISSCPVEQQASINYPSIKETDSIRNVILDIKAQINFNKQKILIAFDIDGTLIFPCAKDAGDGKLVESVKVEKNVPDIINDISKYADVICLTARGLTRESMVDLKEYNFNLTNIHNKITLNDIQKQVIENPKIKKQKHSYSNNIIYAGYVYKGEALKIFYDFSVTKYDKVFFIDDIIENCESVNSVLTDNNIQVQTYLITVDFRSLATKNTSEEYPVTIESTIAKNQAYFHGNKNLDDSSSSCIL